MSNLKFLADMNISPQTVSALQARGYAITRVSDVLLANAADADILSHSHQNNLIIVTQDLDFSTLIALSGQTVPSLVTIRMSDSSPDKVTTRLLQVLPEVADILPLGFCIIISDTHHRLRKLPFKVMADTPSSA